MYDNLFWNRWAKDIAMITARSVGWNWGTWRVIFGGAVDLGVQTARGAAGVGRRLRARRPSGEDAADAAVARVNARGSGETREGLTFRASYLIGFTTMTAAIGAISAKLSKRKAAEREPFRCSRTPIRIAGLPTFSPAQLSVLPKDSRAYFSDRLGKLEAERDAARKALEEESGRARAVQMFADTIRIAGLPTFSPAQLSVLPKDCGLRN